MWQPLLPPLKLLLHRPAPAALAGRLSLFLSPPSGGFLSFIPLPLLHIFFDMRLMRRLACTTAAACTEL